MAKSLKVTQATVIRAYEDLIKENLIVSYVGRGTFVNDIENIQVIKSFKPDYKHAQSPLESTDPEFAVAARKLRMGISQSLDSLTAHCCNSFKNCAPDT